MTIKDYAIKAFREGSDNFGETVTGEVCELKYNTMKAFGGKNPHYVMIVMLKEPSGPSSTSGIGFYKVDGKLRPCSGHMLPWSIDITPEIQSELDKAPHEDF